MIVEVRPGQRFEQMALTLFSLAREGKTDKKGFPNPLQMAVIGQEYKDVVQFMSPPPWIQGILFGLLAPVGRMLGYKASYPRHLQHSVESVEVEPLPEGIQFRRFPRK